VGEEASEGQAQHGAAVWWIANPLLSRVLRYRPSGAVTIE
jgi:hypothetical protein